ncbi:hypothetical protein ACOQFV_02510 [Nocardiopsis changdeensis]|uniref:Uncharacterized protein n=1 Tax=Nocardiopsis changdeensis TaxID=2831969 RepID=A0ABX8BKA9_9ACTN|nr:MULTISPECIES: hypothetical protein [Nocardiopsis]QUX22509.1 hypothetical protein KGD84_30085 [Nocardiopsis changdeensis]QYX38451.1 hypothetical protein K1J57_07465 [Nocardiopsis sp. MT53]
MYDEEPDVTISDWFTHARITSGMLRALDRIGPGGVIIADLFRQDYRVTHAQTLAPDQNRTHFIVYGHHDLTWDLRAFRWDYGERAWEELVAAVDCTAIDCMDDQLDNIAATGYVVTRMRHHLRRYDLDLTAVPHYRDKRLRPGGPTATRRTVTDRYAYRAAPSITVTVTSPVDETTGALSLIRITDRGRHVSGWPARMRNQFTAAHHAHRVSEAIQAYLRRTRT